MSGPRNVTVWLSVTHLFVYSVQVVSVSLGLLMPLWMVRFLRQSQTCRVQGSVEVWEWNSLSTGVLPADQLVGTGMSGGLFYFHVPFLHVCVCDPVKFTEGTYWSTEETFTGTRVPYQ